MIISESNDFVAEVHDRMPVLLAPDQFEDWLSGNMTVEELKLAPNDYLPSAGRAVPARRLFGPTL